MGQISPRGGHVLFKNYNNIVIASAYNLNAIIQFYCKRNLITLLPSYCRLGIIHWCKITIFSLSPFNSEKFTTANIYFMKALSEKKTYIEIIAKQIAPDTENSDKFT